MDYSTLKEQISNEIKQSPIARMNTKALNQLIANGSADYVDAAEYSKVLGDVASKSIQRNITEGIPDDELGAFANECLAPVYRQCQDTMLEACKNIQKVYNANAGIALNPVEVDRDESRISHIVDRFNGEESFETLKFLTNANVARSITRGAVQDSIKANSNFQEKAGLNILISRSDGSGCCNWCAGLVGTYDSFDKLPSDFWRIHRGCSCVIDYKVGRTHEKISFKTNEDGSMSKIIDEIEDNQNDNIKRIPQFPASIMSERVENGIYSLKLSKQQYDKHIDGTKAYDTYRRARINKNLSPQSRLLISYNEAQEIIEKYSGTGIIKSDRNGNPMNIENITCNKVIGEYMQKGEWIKTNKAALHYSEKGTHIVPIKGSKYD